MSTGQPDAIEMKENDASGRSQPTQQEISVEENPAYDVTGHKMFKLCMTCTLSTCVSITAVQYPAVTVQK